MNEKLNDALNGIGDKHIQEAARPRKRRPYWIAAVAAVLAMVILLSALWKPSVDDPVIQGTNPTGHTTQPTDHPDDDPTQPTGEVQLSQCVAAPTYPTMMTKPNRSDYSDTGAFYEDLRIWTAAMEELYDQPEGYADSLEHFFGASISEFLTGEENQAYSPVNVYLAMAMLAETTGGNSRQQILDLFGLESIEELREQASHVWNAHYRDDGETTSLLANSLWLDHQYSFHQNTVDLLAEHYYASTFHGDLGTEPINEQLRSWLNEQTGGLLEEQTKEIELPPRTVFALASTIYFKAGWAGGFVKEFTADDVFHTPDGDKTVPFMKDNVSGAIYYGSNFKAACLELSGDNGMWIILPNEGVTVAEVLAGDEYLKLTLDPDSWKNRSDVMLEVKLPKFDVSSKCDLIEGMQNLGLTDIFDPNFSDFTPMTDHERLRVSHIDHAARVAIDEEGIVAAAFTLIVVEDESAPAPVDFTVDRPFLFVVSSQDNLPLFAGVVTEP